MAIYELWIERSLDGKHIGGYNRIPAEPNKTSSFFTHGCDSALSAAQTIRAEVRKVASMGDQFRVRDRSIVYDNINDALEDILR